MLDRLVVRDASLDEILDLRTTVLIAGTDRDSPAFDGDGDATTRHFGVFSGDAVVACASCMRAADGAWQLRGMATAPAFRSQGVGSWLLAHVEAQLLDGHPGTRLWCNARVRAAPFYERAGWNRVGAVFEIDGVGPHVEMVRASKP